MTGEATRHMAVGLSVESAAGAWARREEAPHGAMVTLDAEVAGRRRGGVPAPPGPAIGVIVRPSLTVDNADRLWLVGLVAAHRTIRSPGSLRVGWPDSLHVDATPIAFINVTAQLGPGRVEMAILSVRAVDALWMPKPDEFRVAVLLALAQAESGFSDLAADYAAVSSIHGQRVRVVLLPRGETRGTVAGVEADGRLRLETPTGMVESIAASSVRRIDVI